MGRAVLIGLGCVDSRDYDHVVWRGVAGPVCTDLVLCKLDRGALIDSVGMCVCACLYCMSVCVCVLEHDL